MNAMNAANANDEELLSLERAQDLAGLSARDVQSVYSGRPGCMCGCRGKYRYSSEHREVASKRRGYAVDNDEVNDQQVRKVLALVQANWAQAEDFGDGFFLELAGRYYAVYEVKKS